MTDEKQVCGDFQCSSNCNLSRIGNGYDYSGHNYCSSETTADGPTALDGVQVYTTALTTAQLQEIHDRSLG